MSNKKPKVAIESTWMMIETLVSIKLSKEISSKNRIEDTETNQEDLITLEVEIETVAEVVETLETEEIEEMTAGTIDVNVIIDVEIN